jgi:predicted dehydrogenase
MNYAPEGKPSPVCKSGDFPFAAAHLEHGHIYGQCNGLIEAGGTLRWVFDPDPAKIKAFCERFPQAKPAASLEQILDDASIRLIAAAAIPSERGPLGCRILNWGKDYFTDKTPFTSLDQLQNARETAARTQRKYMVYYSERLHVECAVLAGQLIEQGVIGRVFQTIGSGPHRLNAGSRPPWFFEKAKYGGILCDIGSHQSEQFLYYTGAGNATVNYSAAANINNPQHPELEDFGEASLTADNGASGYYRVDWLTPGGLRSWGDGRTFLFGTKGTIELRKYIEPAAPNPEGDQLYLVDETGEHHISCAGKVGYPFFGRLILDCLNRTENAMTQEHAFKAAELCLQAQVQAIRLQ